jgi:hypothetical protein
MGLNWWSNGRNWNGFGFWKFWGNFWRRGAHVNTPKIGSRGEENCLGEFGGVYAVLRREFVEGELRLRVFRVLVGGPREVGEEGGQLVLLFCAIGGFCWGNSLVLCLGWPIELWTCVRDEGFGPKRAPGELARALAYSRDSLCNYSRRDG